MLADVQDGSVSATVIQQQVDKILRSAEFGGSEVLRNLLSFLTTHSLERPGEQIKEYELAVAVLGKAEGLRSAVRVHASRLRSKLAEYYMSDGAEDPLLIEVPKGCIRWCGASGTASLTCRPRRASCLSRLLRPSTGGNGSPPDRRRLVQWCRDSASRDTKTSSAYNRQVYHSDGSVVTRSASARRCMCCITA